LNETLTINNTLALAGTCLVQIGKSGTTAVNDQIVGVTDVTYGGTLVVTNMDASALAAGDVFTLFVASGAKTGNFTNLVLLPANASLTLAFDPSTGQLTLGSAAPPVLGYANTGSGLTFTWTESGFKLQAQTNTLNVGLSTNWFDYPGGAASPVTVPYDAAQGSVFFRLIKP
jgi:hypothetical protein